MENVKGDICTFLFLSNQMVSTMSTSRLLCNTYTRATDYQSSYSRLNLCMLVLL